MDSAPAPHRLGPDNLTEGFASGARELDQWLTRSALESQRAGNAVVYVVERDGRIAGYYAIAMAGVSRELVPERLHPRSRPTEVPCALLARLAADMRWQGMGLGRLLLRDALARSALLSQSIGAAAVLVHCRDDQAKSFYLRNGDFLELPGNPYQLMIPVKTLRRYLPQAAGHETAG